MICDIHGQWGPTTAAPSWNQPDHVKSQLLQRGITMGCFASALAKRYDMVAGNDAVYEAAGSKGGGVMLKGWLVIQPDQHDESANLMRKYMFHDNFVGAALYPNPATGEPVTLARCQDLLTVFRRYGKALLIQTPTAAAMHAFLVQARSSLAAWAGMNGARPSTTPCARQISSLTSAAH
ncbi:MAG: hypothetical protein RLZZ78_2033 [Armatimonadota bacterium]